MPPAIFNNKNTASVYRKLTGTISSNYFYSFGTNSSGSVEPKVPVVRNEWFQW